MKNNEYISDKLNKLIAKINAEGTEYIDKKYANAEANVFKSKFGGRCLLWYVQGHDTLYVQLPDGSVITQDEDNETAPIFPYAAYDYRESVKYLNSKLKESNK